MELIAYWKIIRKHLWLLVVLMLLGAIGAAAYTYTRVPLYSTTTTLFLNPAVPVLPFQQTRTVDSFAKTYAEYMRTSAFAQGVTAKLSMPITESQINSSLTTRFVADTQFFRITATHPNPNVAWELANNAAHVLIGENIARQQAQQQQLLSQRDPSQSTERQKLIDLQTLLEDEVTQYEDEIDDLQIQLAALQAKEDTSSVERRQEVRGDLASVRSLRLQALSSLAETQSTLASTDAGAISADTAVIVDVALLPSRPLPSRMLLNVLLGLIVGLMGALGIAFVLEYLDYTIKTPEMLDAVYGMATQGVIGIVPGGKDDKAAYALVTVQNTHSATAESFRSLRTGVQISGVDKALKSLLVTSAGPGEGKTFVAANLAVTMAQFGKRVILVDTDLRRPMVHEVFGMLRTIGLTNYVAQQSYDLDDIIKPTYVENLSVITSGVLPPNPSELLGSKRMLDLMKALEKRADLVIFDTPPAATVTDAAIIAPHVDAVFQVVLAGQTRIDLVLRCKTLLERVGARMLGPVLNQVNLQDMGYYAYYYKSEYSSDDVPPPPGPTGLRRFLPERFRSMRPKKQAGVPRSIGSVLDRNISQD